MKKFLTKEWLPEWLGLGALIVWLFVLVPQVLVFDGDTFFYIWKAQRMLDTGDFLNTSIVMTKPVLGLWGLAGSLKLFGLTLFGVYFWHSCAALLAIAALYFVVMRFVGRQEALIAAGVMATALMFFYQSGSPMLDIPMILFLIISMGALFGYYQTKKLRYVLMAGIFCGLNFLTKGLMGAVLPILVYGGLILWERKLPTLKDVGQAGVALVVFVLIVSVWLVPQLMAHGPSFAQALVRENIERFFHPIDETGGYRQVSAETQRDPQVNILYLILSFLPWSAFIIPAAAWATRQRSAWYRFGLIWFYVILFLTSVSGHYKGPRYLLPLFPALAILVAGYMHAALVTGKAVWPKVLYRAQYVLGVLLALITIGLFFAKFTNGEEQFVPLVALIFGGLAVCLLAGAWFWSKARYIQALRVMGTAIVVVYVLFLTAGVGLTKQLLPECATAQYFKAHNIAVTDITVFKYKVQSLDFYMGQRLKHVGELSEVKTAYVVADKRESKKLKGYTTIQSIQLWRILKKN